MASSFSANYSAFQHNGSFLLVKVEGDLVHDESLVAYPLANTDLHVSTGTFNVDWLCTREIKFWTPPVSSNQYIGIDNALSVMTRNHEDEFTTFAPNEVPQSA